MRIGFVLGSLTLFTELAVVAVLLRLGTLDIEEIHLLVADVIKSFDTVDRATLVVVLSSLGLPAWFRHAYFEYHSHVRVRFKLAAGLGELRDGGVPQGVPLEYDVSCCVVLALV